MSGGDWLTTVEATINKLVGDVVERIERNAETLKAVENYFFLALVGRRVNRYARLERILVTSLGSRSHELFLPFFLHVEKVRKPFDFTGLLKRNMERYTVKAVLSDQAFNSTMQNRVAEAAGMHTNPIVLTIQGDYFPPRDLGQAKWLCAFDSWRLVTGERDAYRKVRDAIFRVCSRYRSRIYAVINSLDENSRLGRE
ncbi:MAG: hypothetical protein QXL28_03885 [Desulfurococcaceae archaeon]